MRLELEKEYYSGVMEKDRYDIIVGSVDEREHQLMSEITKLENELDIITQKDKWLDWIDTHLSNIDELYKIKDLKRKREVIKKYIENIEVQWGEKSRQHTIIMTMKLPLVDDGLKYKKGKNGQYVRDRKGFKRYDVVEGKKEIFTPYLHLNSFQGNRTNLDVSKDFIPFLFFDYIITTHQFSTSRYFTKPITKERRIIRQKVRELSNQGLT